MRFNLSLQDVNYLCRLYPKLLPKLEVGDDDEFKLVEQGEGLIIHEPTQLRFSRVAEPTTWYLLKKDGAAWDKSKLPRGWKITKTLERLFNGD